MPVGLNYFATKHAGFTRLNAIKNLKSQGLSHARRADGEIIVPEWQGCNICARLLSVCIAGRWEHTCGTKAQ